MINAMRPGIMGSYMLSAPEEYEIYRASALKAIEEDNYDALERIAQTIDLSLVRLENGFTLLHYILVMPLEEKEKFVALCLEKGISPRTKDQEGNTSFILALIENKPEITKQLIDAELTFDWDEHFSATSTQHLMEGGKRAYILITVWNLLENHPAPLSREAFMDQWFADDRPLADRSWEKVIQKLNLLLY